jgi:cytochrome c biogenesis protein CcmG/thiol:disulfide interchange protein DsbE
MSQTPNPSPAAKKGPGLAVWLPLGLFAAFLALVIVGLFWPADREVSSAFIGKPVPAFDLPPATDDRPGLATAVFKQGKPRLLNVFASWCVPCAVEAPQLAALAQQGVAIEGVALRDRKEDLARFLAQNGNPFASIGKDDLSQVQIAIGSSGVPETFVVDGKGIIRYQHIGDLRPEDLPMILRKLAEAQQ